MFFIDKKIFKVVFLIDDVLREGLKETLYKNMRKCHIHDIILYYTKSNKQKIYFILFRREESLYD
jgi:hypothetical protein